MTDTYTITRETLGPDHNGTIGTNVYVDGMHVGSYTGRTPDNEIEAKAALFSAAPELLSALQNMTEQFRIGELNVKKDYSKMVAHAAAIKAIRKATGETP